MDTITARLSELGLSRYTEVFQRKDIGPDLLESLTDQDLRDLGVQSLSRRKKLFKAIDAPRSPGRIAPPRSPDRQAALRPVRTDPHCLRLLRSIPTLVPIVLCAALSAEAADLEIEVRGIKVRTGQVHAALFASAEDFSLDLAFRAMITRQGEISIGVFTKEGHMPRPPTEKVSAPANARTLHLRMSDVAPGTYALALYHDVNDDGKVDTNFDGEPLEPWGMSNNPRVIGRSPTWSEAQFALPPKGARLVIDLQ